jgi:hypothetical protein
MRADAKVLLERLGKSDFRYREFVDRFADLESWPIFEALLKDPRIMPQDEVATIEAAEPGDGARQPAPRAAPRPVQATLAAKPAPAPAEPAASLFGRYGRPERAQNIRSLLQRLSDAVEGGDA